MSKVTVLTHIGLPGDGQGIVAHAVRAHELSQALARRGHKVDLLTIEGGRRRRALRASAVATAAEGDVAVMPTALSHVAQEVKQRSRSCAVVLDMFDAALISVIPDLPQGALGEIQFELYRLALEPACHAADLFLCASAEQRFWLLGVLSAWGRLSPRTYFNDPVAIVPTGAPRDVPAASGPPLFRGRILPDEAVVVLWPGGVFNHYQPAPLLLAMPQIVRACPSVRVVFVGASNTAFSGDNATVRELYAQAAELNRAGPLVFFQPPLPYLQRSRMYADADLAVCLFDRSLEAELSFRTRLVDVLWGGVPVVTSSGSGLARLVSDTESGVAVDTLNPADVANAIIALARDPARRRRMAVNARRCAVEHLCWDDVVEPLHRFCVRPAVAVDSEGLSRRFSLSSYGRLDRSIRRAALRAMRKMLILGGRA